MPPRSLKRYIKWQAGSLAGTLRYPRIGFKLVLSGRVARSEKKSDNYTGGFCHDYYRRPIDWRSGEVITRRNLKDATRCASCFIPEDVTVQDGIAKTSLNWRIDRSYQINTVVVPHCITSSFTTPQVSDNLICHFRHMRLKLCLGVFEKDVRRSEQSGLKRQRDRN